MQNQSYDNFIITFGNKTDSGRVRQRNEDYLESFKYDSGYVFVVCDGMGGHVGGEIASRLAASTVKNVFISNPNNLTSPSELIVEGIVEANRAVFNKSYEDVSLKGMGTTCLVLFIKDGIAYYGNAGDSRLYLIRDNKVFQLTKDHSFVQNLVDRNLISEKEAESHPRKNEITKAVGVSNEIIPDVSKKGLSVYQEDFLILCTDGLSNMISEREMMETVVNSDPIEASNRLVEMANIAGGFDNITVQVIKVTFGDVLPAELKKVVPVGAVVKSYLKIAKLTGETQIQNKIERKKHFSFVIVIFVILFILVMALIYMLLFYDNDDKLIPSFDSTNSPETVLYENTSNLGKEPFKKEVYAPSLILSKEKFKFGYALHNFNFKKYYSNIENYSAVKYNSITDDIEFRNTDFENADLFGYSNSLYKIKQQIRFNKNNFDFENFISIYLILFDRNIKVHETFLKIGVV